MKTGKIIIPANVDLWEHELFIAKALSRAGYEVRFIKKDDENKSADAYLDGTMYEFKSLRGKNIDCIERNLKRASKQSENIVICSARVKNVRDKSIERCLAERMKRKHGVKKIIFIDRSGRVIDINAMI